MKFLKNIALTLLISSFSISSSIPIFAKQINNITDFRTEAKVLEVLSGDSLKVQLPNNDIAYVKIKGITTNGFDESYSFLIDSVLGQNIILTRDGASYNSGKFTYMNVYLNNLNIAEEMIKLGYAVIDKKQDKGTDYNKFVSAQDEAKKNSSGLWIYENPNYSTLTGFSQENISYTNDKVNINTATKEQLKTLLKGIDDTVAKNIVAYRDANLFSNIQEIKFVDGFTKKMYDDNKIALTVSTNINKANEYELRTLGISNDEISKIITERNKKEFSSINNLKDFVSRSLYYKIEKYISIDNRTSVDDDTSILKANVGLSERSYLSDVGVSYKIAKDIVSYREYGYTYKTLYELTRLGTANANITDINYLQDNLEIYTNINTASKKELISIFGSKNGTKIYDDKYTSIADLQKILSKNEYEKMKANIYEKEIKPEYININTATKQELVDAGLSSAQVDTILRNRPITNPSQIHIDVTNVNDKISLYTNINTASEKELKSLNNNITSEFIDKLIKRRKEEIFGSITEVEQFFKDNNAPLTFKQVKQFIVVR